MDTIEEGIQPPATHTQQRFNAYVRELKHIIIGLTFTAYIIYGAIVNKFDNDLFYYLYGFYILYEINRCGLYRLTIQKLVDIVLDIFEETIYRNYITCIISLIISGAVGYQCYLDTTRIYPLCSNLIMLLVASLVNFRKIISIHWSVVVRSLNMHFMLAFVFFFFSFGRRVILSVGEGIVSYMKFSELGSRFVYGNSLIDGSVFAFYVLSTVYLSFMTVAVLRHIGFLDYMVELSQKFAFTLGISPIEGAFGIMNMFLSMTDTCLIIRCRLTKLCISELFALLVTGMSTISCTAFFAFVSMGANINYLLTSCIIAIPCSFMFAKIFHPADNAIEYSYRSEIQPLHTISEIQNNQRPSSADNPNIDDKDINNNNNDNNFDVQTERRGLFDKCTDSLADATIVIQCIISNFIAIMSFVAAIDYTVKIFMSPFVKDTGLLSSLSYIIAYVLPMMGVDRHDASLVAEMLVKKIMINEFVSYRILGENINNFKTERSLGIANAMMCGFGNISAAGMLSAIIALLTRKQVNVSHLIIKALIVACMVNVFCACTLALFIDNQ